MICPPWAHWPCLERYLVVGLGERELLASDGWSSGMLLHTHHSAHRGSPQRVIGSPVSIVWRLGTLPISASHPVLPAGGAGQGVGGGGWVGGGGGHQDRRHSIAPPGDSNVQPGLRPPGRGSVSSAPSPSSGWGQSAQAAARPPPPPHPPAPSFPSPSSHLLGPRAALGLPCATGESETSWAQKTLRWWPCLPARPSDPPWWSGGERGGKGGQAPEPQM